MKLHTGDVFIDKYEVLHQIGKGAFARVYKARDRRLDRDVAIKLLRLEDPVARKRFEVEAKIISRLENVATVRVHDYGIENDTPFMVLAFVPGRTLRAVIDWRGPFSPERTMDVLMQVLGSVAEAHEMGVLHRDLKPANIMLYQPDPASSIDRVKVLDFGLAKLLSQKSLVTLPRRLTATGTTVGTIRYMSPEQLRGRTLGPESDVFSIGLLAYEMLCGRHPYEEAKGADVGNRLLNSDPIELPASANVPPDLAYVVHRMMRKPKGERYPDAREALRALAALGEPTAEMRAFDALRAVQEVNPRNTGEYEGVASYVSFLEEDPFESSYGEED